MGSLIVAHKQIPYEDSNCIYLSTINLIGSSLSELLATSLRKTTAALRETLAVQFTRPRHHDVLRQAYSVQFHDVLHHAFNSLKRVTLNHFALL